MGRRTPPSHLPRRTSGAGALYSVPMTPSYSSRPHRHSLAAFAVLALSWTAGCRAAGPADPAPPAAEFVLAAGDSAFWVTSTAGSVHVRGAPLELARVAGRFYELYVADDDRSFQDATFIGQRVFRRDLVRGDSSLVYEDSTVPRLANEYARRFPDDRPLHAEDEPSDDPRWRVVATLDLTEVHGPFVSFDTHTDVERQGTTPWHASRRGVIDLRGGGSVSLASVVSRGPTLSGVERQRAAVLRATLDSVRATHSTRGTRARALLPFYRLDPGSFSITTVDGAPAVAYALAGSGDGDAGHLFPLPPIRIGEPAWWPEVATTLPVGSASGARDVWRHGSYEVVVRYDSGGARLALRDSTSREWSVTRVPAPATRIFWLDAPAIDSVSRHALERAFDESTLYDETVRTASDRTHRAAFSLRLAAQRSRGRARLSRGHRTVPHA